MFAVCEKWVETRTDSYIDPSSSLDHSSTSFASWLGLLNRGSLKGPKPSVWSWFSLRHPVYNWLEPLGHLVISFSNGHLILLFFRLFTQVHLLIDGSFEGQYITLPASLNLLCHSKTHARFMQDAPIAVWSIPYVSVVFFPSLKHNFIAYCSSKVTSRPDWIFEIHQLWQSGFSRVYSNCCSSCSFEAEIIKIGQSSHKMYSNNILNFQESTTILNACTKKLLNVPRIILTFFFFVYFFIYRCSLDVSSPGIRQELRGVPFWWNSFHEQIKLASRLQCICVVGTYYGRLLLFLY